MTDFDVQQLFLSLKDDLAAMEGRLNGRIDRLQPIGQPCIALQEVIGRMNAMEIRGAEVRGARRALGYVIGIVGGVVGSILTALVRNWR
jgi:hypothetical protein